MQLNSSSSRIYHCPRCLATISVRENDERTVLCPACGNTRTVSHRYFSLVACLIIVVSYACSFLVVHLLTHDIVRFMLPALEIAFILLAVSVLLLFSHLRPSAPPKKLSRLFRHGSLVPRH